MTTSATPSFFSLGTEHRLGKDNRLLKLNKLINWEALRPLLKGLHRNEENSKGGPIAYDPIKMVKALLLGQWHSLSDPKLEESLRVRLDFMAFTGFEMSEDLPDETTLCRFRNKLIELGINAELLNVINHQLEQLGLKIESAKGAVIDATIIESAARPRRVIECESDREESDRSDSATEEQEKEKNEDKETEDNKAKIHESADPDAKWLKKGSRSFFGYKGFMRVTEKDGYIQDTHVTPANLSETKQFSKILEGCQSADIYADKGYASEANRTFLKQRKKRSRIMAKAARNTPLTNWQKVLNRLISKRRYVVEQGFGTLKRRFEFRRASYMTTEKVQAQFQLKAICFNLLKASNAFQAA